MPTLLMRLLSTRIGPMLGRLAKTMPQLEARLATALRNAGANAGTSMNSIVAYARKSPLNMALLATTLASLGIDIGGWFTKGELDKDEESNQFVSQLKRVSSNRVSDVVAVQNSAAVAGGLDSISDTTVTYRPGLADKTDSLATMSVATRWAISFFGGRDQAAQGLKMLDVLLATSVADREAALRFLR